tara:strand:+ start:812 stop:1753 length:942 start_codon:yes stop_codon:yes gene_type:complete
MAINVNTVYQTVLLILNKEQRGYMTPLEFNKIGAQVQGEIFETYFDSLNQQLRTPQADTDYANRVVSLDEKISIFKTSNNAVYSNGTFQLPSQYSGTASTSQTFTITNPGLTYTLTGSSATLSAGNYVSNAFEGATGSEIELASTSYGISGTTVTVPQYTAANKLIINLYPTEFYRLGNVIYTLGAIPSHELQRVQKSELYHLLSSNLTKPSTIYPIYTYENNLLTVYPTSIQTGLTVDYLRKPIAPIWNFSIGGNGQYTFVPSTSFNFELHPAERMELILKILLYAGVVVKSPEIVDIAAQQVAQENQNQQI